MATDQDAAPYVGNDNQGSFHRSQHASETTSLISSSPSSGDTQPVKMSKPVRNKTKKLPFNNEAQQTVVKGRSLVQSHGLIQAFLPLLSPQGRTLQI